jgi:hypothetical protein
MKLFDYLFGIHTFEYYSENKGRSFDENGKKHDASGRPGPGHHYYQPI